MFDIFKKKKPSEQSLIIAEVERISKALLPLCLACEFKTKHNEVLKYFNRKFIKECISTNKEIICHNNRIINTNKNLLNIYTKLKYKMDRDTQSIDMYNVMVVCSILLNESIIKINQEINDRKNKILNIKKDLKSKVKLLNINSKIQYSLHLLKLIASKYNVNVNELNNFDKISFDILDKNNYDDVVYFLNLYNNRLNKLVIK